ncbi:MAG: alcohol dehydrogenase catalytic domain-containing protein [Anaerostipes sp.]|uniref:alcohol dehydrogenase catalytic domain-containing protein n=1 Tax=Anaerostipes sp. TaxID=1872530 RepID=UPI003992E7A2
MTNSGDSRFQIGDRVVFWANLYCGKCDMCMSGQEQLCREICRKGIKCLQTAGYRCI